MTGIIDVGGGMRCVYSSGVYDFFLDRKITFDYYLGVSAGSANLITYLSSQRGRTRKFYTDYSFRSDYMSAKNFLKNGSYINLDYVFSTLTNEDGENPLDYETFVNSKGTFLVAATNAQTGEAVFFGREDVKRNDYAILKASCCIPAVCKPYEIDGQLYYDGGVAEPIPIKKAFEDGCDKVVLVLTKPRNEYRHQSNFSKPLKYVLGNKKIVDLVSNLPKTCCAILDEAEEYEKQGKLLIIEPDDCLGMDTLTRDRDLMYKFYCKGYTDAQKAFEHKEFFIGGE